MMLNDDIPDSQSLCADCRYIAYISKPHVSSQSNQNRSLRTFLPSFSSNSPPDDASGADAGAVASADDFNCSISFLRACKFDAD